MSNQKRHLLLAAAVLVGVLLLAFGLSLLLSGYREAGTATAATGVLAALETARRYQQSEAQRAVDAAQTKGRSAATQILLERKAELDTSLNIENELDALSLNEKVDRANKRKQEPP